MALRCLMQGVVMFFMAAVVTSTATAGEPTDAIRETSDKIISVVSDPALKGPEKASERKRRIRKAVDERFNWKEMSRRALARHWKERADAEKREFIDLFGKLLERTYLNNVEGYSGEKVLYVGETVDQNYGMVTVKIVTKKNTDILVKYKVKKEGTKWLVYDISIQGVSLINNYRKQFNAIILRSSYKDLVKTLEAKVAEDEV